MKNIEPNAWEFVEEYYPNYHSSAAIAEYNDLCKLNDKEYEDGDAADDMLFEDYDGDIDNPKIKTDIIEIEMECYKGAIEMFMLQNTKQNK